MTKAIEQVCATFALGLRQIADAIELLPAALKEHYEEATVNVFFGAGVPVDTEGEFKTEDENAPAHVFVQPETAGDAPSTVSEQLIPDEGREQPVPFELQSVSSTPTTPVEEAPLASFPEVSKEYDYDTAILTGYIAGTFKTGSFSAQSLAAHRGFSVLPFLDHDFSLPFEQQSAAVGAFLKEIAGRGQVIAQVSPTQRRFVSIKAEAMTGGFETYRLSDNGIAA